jgi:hypothetical protein
MSLINTNSNSNYNAISTVDNISINLSANSYNTNQVSFTINIDDVEKYVTNKDEFTSDFEEFQSLVISKISNIVSSAN